MVGGQASSLGRDSRMYQRRVLLELFGDDQEMSFLFQRISVDVQRFNAVLLPDSLCCAPAGLEAIQASFLCT